MSANIDIKDQVELVEVIAKKIPESWKVIFVNYEMKRTSSGLVADASNFYVKKSFFGKITKSDFPLGADEIIKLNAVGSALMKRADASELTMDVLIKNDGNFRLYVDYDPPARINGDLIAGNRYKRYVGDDPILAALAAETIRAASS